MFDVNVGECRAEAQPSFNHPPPVQRGFSARELEVVRLIAAGATSAEIAEQLSISFHTVKNHRKNILRKAGCRNSGHLVALCIAQRLL
ncbi:helix-turn-helix transcriptional regulator [Microbulbifer sp. SAOS-129_SWC]|uniref:response regulator transcription factor n=1 Tax=Microbulbifer sp. SAOS-129_SWC TaxID=3145235 RepID=UPI003217F566